MNSTATTDASTAPTYRLPRVARQVVESLVPVLAPPEAVMRGLTSDIVDHFELSLSVLPTMFQRGLEAGLLAYDLGAILHLPARGTRAHKLRGAAAVSYFESWHHGPTPLHRELAGGIKKLLCMAVYEMPAMLTSIGYTPTAWIEKVKQRRLATYGADIAKQEAAVFEPDPLPPLTYKRRNQTASVVTPKAGK